MTRKIQRDQTAVVRHRSGQLMLKYRSAGRVAMDKHQGRFTDPGFFDKDGTVRSVHTVASCGRGHK
jgi:hypothetical protein